MGGCMTRMLGRNPAAGGGLASKWRINITDAQNAPSSFVGITELELRETVGGADVTSGATASASAVASGSSAANAIDDNTAVSWDSGTGTVPQWLEVDFASSKTITQVSIRQNAINGAPTAFDVQYYDGAAWQTYWSETSTLWAANYTRVFTKYDSVTAGYFKWRLNITSTKGGGSAWAGVAEIEFRGSVGGADLTAPIGTSNTGDAYGNSTVAGANKPATRGFDDSSANIWQSGFAPSSGSPAQIGYRFPTQTVVAEVAISNTTTLNDSPKAVDVQYFDPSASGGAGAWVTARSIADCGFTATGQTKTFSVP
jgi:hypothetical protein